MKAEIGMNVRLTLSEEEARWIMAMTQNPLMENESPQDCRIRENIFIPLHKIFYGRKDKI